ncbi:hypothetical protein GF402_02600 [Candidatus Fermentibacteria bacterium]|nr:hypothetical protein [Candidatus Fermentibacteria bacterium]
MRFLLLAALLLLLAFGCSVPGMEEVHSKVDDLSDRMEEVAEDAESRADAACEDLEGRVSDLEMQIGAGAGSPSEASASLPESPEASPPAIPDSVIEVLQSQSEALQQLSSRMDSLLQSSAASDSIIESLSEDVDVLEGEVYSLRQRLQSQSSSGGGRTGRGGSGR